MYYCTVTNHCTTAILYCYKSLYNVILYCNKSLYHCTNPSAGVLPPSLNLSTCGRARYRRQPQPFFKYLLAIGITLWTRVGNITHVTSKSMFTWGRELFQRRRYRCVEAKFNARNIPTRKLFGLLGYMKTFQNFWWHNKGCLKKMSLAQNLKVSFLKNQMS